MLREHEVDTVFHLAAQTIVGDGPGRSRSAASRPTSAAPGPCSRPAGEHGVERVVVASSDKAYGAHDELPYREDFALRPTAPYEASKAAADLIARSYWHSYGLPVAVTRFANIYGGGDLNFSRLIPEAVSAALDGRPPGAPLRRLAGARLPLRRGRGPRLPGDRRRASTATTSAARPSTRAAGARTRCVEVVELIAACRAPASSPTSAARATRSGEIDRQYVDPAKIRERCGWEPRSASRRAWGGRSTGTGRIPRRARRRARRAESPRRPRPTERSSRE